LRLDQLLSFAWKFLVPLALVNLVVAVVWWQSGAWRFPAALELRWLLGAGLLAFPYMWLGRALKSGKPVQHQYSYAE
jgi:NADH-quinone oxidoreductase subunit H